jgi:hypothetical protein
MSYAFIQDVPADEHLYREIRDRLGEQPPQGLTAHIVIKRDGGLRYIDVWQSEQDWARFRDAFVEPAVSAVLSSHGIPHDHSEVSFEDIEVIDAWLGQPAGT